MNAPRDPDRMIHAFLMEGEEQLDDQLYDAVRAQIDQKRQRAFIGPWGAPAMNKITFGLGAAAVVLIGAVLGAQLLGSPGTTGSGGPSATPEATATPEPTATAEPTATPDATGVSGPTLAELPEGEWILVFEQLFGVRTTVTISAPEWHGVDTFTQLLKNGEDGPPQGAALTVWGGDLYVYGNPCAWESTQPADPAASLDELAAALSAQALRDATEPVDVTVGGYPAKMLTLHVPEDAVLADCDGGEFRTLQELETGDARTNQGPGQIDEVWVVDVDGIFVFFDAGYFADTPAEHVEEMRAMVASATFEVR